MNLKRTTALVVIGAAVAVWWRNSDVSDSRGSSDARVANPSAVATRGETLAGEISRLHERRRPVIKPTEPGRNLFSYRSPKRRPVPDDGRAATAPRVQAPVPASGSSAVNRAALPDLKLSGIAEDETPDGLVRTAIISGFGRLFLAKEGEEITERYRVVRISSEVVELVDIQTGMTFRLALR